MQAETTLIMRKAILLALIILPSLLAAQQPWETNSHYLAAQAAYANGNYPRATDEFENANRDLDGHCSACLALAARARGRYGQQRGAALAESAQALQLATTAAERGTAHLQRGSILLETRQSPADLASAEAEARAALVEDPRSLEAHILLGLSLLRQGKVDVGLRELQPIADSPDTDNNLREMVRHWIANPKSQRLEFAPDFHITTIDGKTLSLSDFKGKVVLLDFWATWCPPCRAGIPELKRLRDQYQDRLVIVSISVDESAPKWREFVTANQMTWPQTRDADESLRVLFSANVCPTYLLLDRAGVIRLRINGMDPDASITSQLDPSIHMLLP